MALRLVGSTNITVVEADVEVEAGVVAVAEAVVVITLATFRILHRRQLGMAQRAPKRHPPQLSEPIASSQLSAVEPALL
jgi:hypothetical protein